MLRSESGHESIAMNRTTMQLRWIGLLVITLTSFFPDPMVGLGRCCGREHAEGGHRADRSTEVDRDSSCCCAKSRACCGKKSKVDPHCLDGRVELGEGSVFGQALPCGGISKPVCRCRPTFPPLGRVETEGNVARVLGGVELGLEWNLPREKGSSKRLPWGIEWVGPVLGVSERLAWLSFRLE